MHVVRLNSDRQANARAYYAGIQQLNLGKGTLWRTSISGLERVKHTSPATVLMQDPHQCDATSFV
jgi:hypothetical protein